jgi:hypothetical protein
MFRRAHAQAVLRSAIALFAAYALLLNGVLSSAIPLAHTLPLEGIICTHDVAGSDEPAVPTSAHDGMCCVASCSAAAAMFVPVNDFYMLPWAPAFAASVLWSIAEDIVPQRRANFSASPRGPPTLV